MTWIRVLAVTGYRACVRAMPRSARLGFEDDMVAAFADAVASSSSPLRTAAASYADALSVFMLRRR